MGRSIKNFLAFVFIFSSAISVAQEYDDLYFTKSDRVKEKKNKEQRVQGYSSSSANYGTYDLQNSNEGEPTSFLGKQYQNQVFPEDDYTGGVSQELIDQYKSDKTSSLYYSQNSAYTNNPVDYSNPNFSNPQDPYQDQNQNVVINNYYGNNLGNWNRSRWSFGFGWNNWGRNYWGISYGWNSFGNPWYDPFWDPWFYNSWGPSWGFNWGWNSWGWNSWGWNNWGWRGYYDPYWCSPIWRGPYGNPVAYYRGESNRRDVVRGARNSRGGAVSSSGRSSSRNAVANESSDRRNYSRQQAEYLNRSRASRSVNSSVNQGYSSRSTSYNGNVGNSRNNSSYNTGSSTRSRSVYSPPSNGSSRGGSSYGSSRSSSSRSYGGSSVRSGGSSRSSSGRSSGSRSSSSRSSSNRKN